MGTMPHSFLGSQCIRQQLDLHRLSHRLRCSDHAERLTCFLCLSLCNRGENESREAQHQQQLAGTIMPSKAEHLVPIHTLLEASPEDFLRTIIPETSLAAPSIPTLCPGAGSKPGSGKKGAAPAAAAAAAAAGAGKAEDSAHERDDNSESTVSEDSLARLGGRQRSGSIEEIPARAGGSPGGPPGGRGQAAVPGQGQGQDAGAQAHRLRQLAEVCCLSRPPLHHMMPGHCTCLPTDS